MLISTKQLVGLPVETESGQGLGRISEVVIDTEIQETVQYVVYPDLIHGLFGKTLLIHRQQVLGIVREKMIVQDGVVKDGTLQPVADV